MRTCNKCNGNKIKSRKNYPHGRKSKPITKLVCKGCGSSDITVTSNNMRNRRQKRR